MNADFFFPLYNSCVDMTEKSKAVMQQGTVLKKQEKIIINVIHPSWGVISCLSAAPEIKTDCCVTEYIFQRGLHSLMSPHLVSSAVIRGEGFIPI